MKQPLSNRLSESLALTAAVLKKADNVFPHQRHEIEKSMKLKHGAFARVKKGS